ncbi:MAG TPA: hypothetical protein VFM79_08800 [Pelobium sp.]|nr:hypothetical protein [Pelobium sp.]
MPQQIYDAFTRQCDFYRNSAWNWFRFNPPIYLKAGHEVELGIDGLGVAKQSVKAYAKN